MKARCGYRLSLIQANFTQPNDRQDHPVGPTLQMTEPQGLEGGKLICKLNKDGCFIAASLFGNTLRISAMEREIELVKKALESLPR